MKTSTSSRKQWLAGIIITSIVSLFAGGILRPYFDNYFSEHFRLKPDLYIVEKECGMIPLWGTELIATKVVVKNKGNVNENDIVVIFDADPPFAFKQTNSTHLEIHLNSIRAGEATMISGPLVGPSTEYVLHCSVKVVIRLWSETRTWDTITLSGSW